MSFHMNINKTRNEPLEPMSPEDVTLEGEKVIANLSALDALCMSFPEETRISVLRAAMKKMGWDEF